MHLILAIIFKELTAWPRQKRFYLKRLMLVSLSSLVFLYYYFESINSKNGIPIDLGFEVFEAISILSILTVILSSPMVSSSFFAREKEQRTLGILLITEVTPFQLVLSRFIMSIFSNFISLVAIWPILLICLRYGGLNIHHIWVFTLLLFSTMTIGTCIGLLVSTMMMEEKQAFFISIAMATIYFVAVPALIHLAGVESGLAAINDIILPIISPVHTLKIFLESGNNFVFINLAAAIAFSAALFLLTVRLLPIEALRSPHDIDPKHAEIMDAAWRKKKPIKGNPLAWKERPNHSNLLFIFTIVISALIPMPWGIRTGNPQLAMGFGLFVAIVLVVGIGLIVRGALAFVQEKESRTFELLLISDLSEDEIILGKYWGYISSYLPWFPVIIVSFILMCMGEDYQKVSLAFLLFLTVCFCYLNLAILMSLKFRRITALSVSFFIYVFWVVFSSFLIMNVETFFTVIIVSIILNLVAGVALFLWIFKEFKEFANNEEYLNHHQWMN